MYGNVANLLTFCKTIRAFRIFKTKLIVCSLFYVLLLQTISFGLVQMYQDC